MIKANCKAKRNLEKRQPGSEHEERPFIAKHGGNMRT